MLRLAKVLSSFPHTRRHTLGPLSRLFQMPQRNITIPTQSMDNFYGFFPNSNLGLKHQRHTIWRYAQKHNNFLLYKGLVTMWHNNTQPTGNIFMDFQEMWAMWYTSVTNTINASSRPLVIKLVFPISWAQVNWKFFLSYPQLHSAQKRKNILLLESPWKLTFPLWLCFQF